MKRYFLIVGANKFFNITGSNLRGCINDTVTMKARAEKLGADEIEVLTEKDMVTENWKDRWVYWARRSVKGDMFFHAHSHHGAQTPDPNDPTGVDEVWCPPDFDWSPERMITDKWMATAMHDWLVPGVDYMDWADNCHAGDCLRGLSYKNDLSRFIVNPDIDYNKVRTINGQILCSDGLRAGTLFGACRVNQTAADAFVAGDYHGAFTYYGNLLWEQLEGVFVSRVAFMTQLAQLIATNGYSQVPELDSTVEISNWLMPLKNYDSFSAPAA